MAYKRLTPREVGQRIATARDRADMSQHGLAIKLGVSGSGTVAQWERGRNFPEMGTLLKIAEVLNQPLAFFLGDTYAERPGPTAEEAIAERVAPQIADRVVEILKSQNGAGPSDQDWDRLLRELSTAELAEGALASATFGGRTGEGAQRYVRETSASIPPDFLKSLVESTVLQVIDRAKQFFGNRGRRDQ